MEYGFSCMGMKLPVLWEPMAEPDAYVVSDGSLMLHSELPLRGMT